MNKKTNKLMLISIFLPTDQQRQCRELHNRPRYWSHSVQEKTAAAGGEKGASTSCGKPANCEVECRQQLVLADTWNPTCLVFAGKQAFFAWAVCCPITEHVIFSRKFFFYPSKNYSFINTQPFGNSKGRILTSIITWSEMGQQSSIV